MIDLSNWANGSVTDPHVYFGFLSPSGDGYKLGVRINGERHDESKATATAYFLETYGVRIDASPLARNALCFVSHDPDLGPIQQR